MVNLCMQMHTAIPGSEVSTVLYAVDWNNVFDFNIMEPEVDNYIIMGYAYYYQGSSNTGLATRFIIMGQITIILCPNP